MTARTDAAAVTLAELKSLQALAKGEANADQQQRALKWILHKAAVIDQDPFVPGQPDATAYLMGRQSVARQIAAVLQTDPAAATSRATKGNPA